MNSNQINDITQHDKTVRRHMTKTLPEKGFLRLRQIVGDKETPAIIPISKSSWWEGVRTGRFPKPIKLGKRTTVWKISDIYELIDRRENNG